MTQRQGEMRETYPLPGDVYRYQTDEREDQFTFSVAYGSEGESLAELPPAITLSIESRESGEGLCREESGRIHAFAWAWVGPELHLWLEGALYVFQRAEIRRGGRNSAAAQAGGHHGSDAGHRHRYTGQRGGACGAEPNGNGDGVYENGAAYNRSPQWDRATSGSAAGATG